MQAVTEISKIYTCLQPSYHFMLLLWSWGKPRVEVPVWNSDMHTINGGFCYWNKCLGFFIMAKKIGQKLFYFQRVNASSSRMN